MKKVAILILLFLLFVPNISQKIAYYTVGYLFKISSNVVQCGSSLCVSQSSGAIAPFIPLNQNECSLLSSLCSVVSERAFSGPSQKFKDFLSPYYSWQTNFIFLSQIKPLCVEDQQLVCFLKKRWLTKLAGFSSFAVRWIYPCFGVYSQIHPATNHSYARLPSSHFSNIYKKRIKNWKQSLPYPKYFPLILTRTKNIQNYLPYYFNVREHDDIEKIFNNFQNDSIIIADFSDVFSQDRKEWPSIWKQYSRSLSKRCKISQLDPKRIICIQRMNQDEIGGLQILPLNCHSQKQMNEHHHFLLEWISHFGLTANRIELDRWQMENMAEGLESQMNNPTLQSTKEESISFLRSFETLLKDKPLHESLMIDGALKIIKGLLSSISDAAWKQEMHCPARASIVHGSLSNIQIELERLKQDRLSFFEIAMHLEQIHANISPLLEIFQPFVQVDFQSIYKDCLSIPASLQPFADFSIHTSAMTSLAGILKAVQNTTGKSPRILYGENTYYECIQAVKAFATAFSIKEAPEEEWEKTDLLLTQFNPALRTDPCMTQYKVENISDCLHKWLQLRKNAPLTLALDCTLDLVNSIRIKKLFNEFEKEIITGHLNIICYRSGTKFDLFGMDNYCGAPLIMIHNQDPKWAHFDSLLTDPVLQCDLLSVNWFCLAYKYAALQLQLYQRQIMENTRSLLNKIPSTLLNDPAATYRVIPVAPDASPSFIDIKVVGPFHKIKGAGLIGGSLFVQSMDGGHPIFCRPSLGFYHPNFSVIFNEDHTTVRLTLGIDPSQVDLYAKCFETIDSL